jgi:hypothetical protein
LSLFLFESSFVFIFRLGRFEVFDDDDDDSCHSSCFFSFVFTRLHRDDGIAVVVVVAVLAVFSDCFLLFVFRVIISSCLFVRLFVFVLVSRGRGGILEGLGEKWTPEKEGLELFCRIFIGEKSS